MKRLPLLLPLLLATACSKSSDDGAVLKDAGTTDTGVAPDSGVDLGFDSQAVATSLASAQCAFFTRCVPEYYDANATDETACVSNAVENLMAAYQDYAPLIQAGRVVYNADMKDACVQTLQTTDCVLGLADGSPCDRVFTGTQQANQPCFFANECAPNLYCARAQGLGTCGACAVSPGSGQACDAFTPCGENTGCVNVAQAPNQDLRCVPTNAQENDPCFTLETGLCQGDLSCTGDNTNGYLCKRPNGPGATCDNQTFALPDCDVSRGYVCDGTMCTDLDWSDLNGTCGETTACREGSCAGTTCAPLPGAGESCMDTGACGDDAFCDGSNCLPLIAQGQACDYSYECTGTLLCLGAGVSRPGSCGPLDWQLCQ